MTAEYDRSISNWIRLLSATAPFKCPRVRAHAISEIEAKKDEQPALPPIEQAAIAIKHGIEPWLRPAYRELIVSDEMVPVRYTGELPLQVTVLLARCRELYHHRLNWSQKKEPGPKRTAEEILARELAALKIDIMGNLLVVAAEGKRLLYQPLVSRICSSLLFRSYRR